jgi:hypothetical protein
MAAIDVAPSFVVLNTYFCTNNHVFVKYLKDHLAELKILPKMQSIAHWSRLQSPKNTTYIVS